MKIKQSELIELINNAINRKNDLIVNTYNDSNPLIIAMTERAKGAKDALQDVLAAINGNSVYLKILAGK